MMYVTTSLIQWEQASVQISEKPADLCILTHFFSQTESLQSQFSKISNQFFVVAIARWEALSEASIWAVSKGERDFNN